MVGLKENEWGRQVIEGFPISHSGWWKILRVVRQLHVRGFLHNLFCQRKKQTLPKFMLFSLCVRKPFACEDEKEEKGQRRVRNCSVVKKRRWCCLYFQLSCQSLKRKFWWMGIEQWSKQGYHSITHENLAIIQKRIKENR